MANKGGKENKQPIPVIQQLTTNPSSFPKYYRASLTESEHLQLLAYTEKYGGQHLVCALNQRETHGRGKASGEVVLHTQLHNVGLQWALPLNRFLHPVEVLCAHGFPVRRNFSYGEDTCSFTIPRVPARNRTAMAGQAGDTMHVNVVGAVLAYCVFFVSRTSESCDPGDIYRSLCR